MPMYKTGTFSAVRRYYTFLFLFLLHLLKWAFVIVVVKLQSENAINVAEDQLVKQEKRDSDRLVIQST